MSGTNTWNTSPTPYPIGSEVVYVTNKGGLFHGTVYANTVGKYPEHPQNPRAGEVYYRCLVTAHNGRLVLPVLVCGPEDCEAVGQLLRDGATIARQSEEAAKREGGK